MDSLAVEKAALRKEVFARRKTARTADLAADAGQSRAAMDHFLAARMHVGAAVVSGYMPIRTEIDPLPLMTALAGAGHRLCVPVIQGTGMALGFREWRPDCEMVEGEYGALIPATGDWLEPELVIAPLVAFDRQGWRLGYGGGYYDRTLAGLRAKRRTLAVGLAYSVQEVPAVPRDATDMRLVAIVTEQGVIRPGQGRG